MKGDVKDFRRIRLVYNQEDKEIKRYAKGEISQAEMEKRIQRIKKNFSVKFGINI